MANRSAFLDYLENLPQRLLYWLTKPMSRRMRGRFGGWAARRAILNMGGLRGRVRKNLVHVYPDLSDAERAAIMRDFATTIGHTFVNVLHARDFLSSMDRIKVIPGPGLDAVTEAQKEERPALLISGHYGPWEATRVAMRKLGLQPAAFYRPLKNPYANKDLVARYSDFGKPMFPKGRTGTRAVIKHLRDGGLLCLMHDQRMLDGKVMDFMGKPAMTSLVGAELALKFNAPIVPVYPRWCEDNYHIEIHFEDPLPHTDAESITQAMNDSLTARIRKEPRQWYWLHRRWKLTHAAQQEVDDSWYAPDEAEGPVED
ncbi:lysophospholipid acyltransferase family protein [Halovulum sp. GXIMD14793]